MWRILLRMLSTGSLAAFSAALTPPTVSPPSVASSGPPALSSLRALPVSARSAPSAASQPLPTAKPGQILPRGSLLNLSV